MGEAVCKRNYLLAAIYKRNCLLAEGEFHMTDLDRVVVPPPYPALTDVEKSSA